MRHRTLGDSGLLVTTQTLDTMTLLERSIEWELVPLCLDEGIGILPWGPLGGGG